MCACTLTPHLELDLTLGQRLSTVRCEWARALEQRVGSVRWSLRLDLELESHDVRNALDLPPTMAVYTVSLRLDLELNVKQDM